MFRVIQGLELQLKRLGSTRNAIKYDGIIDRDILPRDNLFQS